MKHRMLSFLLAAVLALSLTPAARAAESFTDVPSTHWAYADIQSCAEAGIVTGMGDGKFYPGDEVTGTQFIVMMTRTFYNDQVEAAKKAETSSWYAPNMKVANDVKMLEVGGYYTLTVTDKPMNRYDMAFVLCSTLNANGKLAGVKDRNAAKASIKDAGSIPTDRAFQVYNAYHFGIITGMSDGTFSGTQSMTRAQACAVIVRMMNLLGSEAPDQPEQPVQPAQPEQTQQTAGKLTNGEDATPENVRAMLKEIEEKYPEGTPWGDPAVVPNTKYYIRPATSAISDVVTTTSKVAPTLNLMYGCGGWMAMVSESIFGISGAPCREVYSIKDARPGDLLYKFGTNGRISHVGIITSVTKNTDDGTWRLSTCNGNINGGYVNWEWNNEWGLSNLKLSTGITYRIFTRYPE